MRKLHYQNTILKRIMFDVTELPINVLIFGQHSFWLVQTSTCHTEHFVGTQREYCANKLGPKP